MIYEETIFEKNGIAIPNAFIKINQNDKEILTIYANENGYWSINSETDGGLLTEDKTWSFCGDGFPCYNITGSLIPQIFDVELSKEKSYLPYLIGGGAI